MSLHSRTRQFFHALAAPFIHLDHQEINRLLTPELAVLFYRLSPSERSHSVRVLKSLRAEGCDDPELLAAALLHDVGKSRFRLRLYERVIIVLADRFAAVDFPGNTRGRLALVRKVAHEHPQWGAEMVLEAGASELVAWLVENHQADVDADAQEHRFRLLAALQAADKEN